MSRYDVVWLKMKSGKRVYGAVRFRQPSKMSIASDGWIRDIEIDRWVKHGDGVVWRVDFCAGSDTRFLGFNQIIHNCLVELEC